MGLDVYLERCENWDDELRRSSECETARNAIWDKALGGKDYSDATEAEKQMGYDKIDEFEKTEIALNTETSETISFDSDKYPNHLFKVGYLRSSYNEGGINSVLKSYGIPDLYYIFDPDEHNYNTEVDWEEALERCNEVIQKFSEIAGGSLGKYSCSAVSFNMFIPKEELPTSPEEAMKLFKNELETVNDKSFSSYSNRNGRFSFPAKKISGLIPGYQFNTPTMFVVYETDEDNGLEFYTQALEITKEMIEYVLDQPNPEYYRLSWSS